MTAEDSQRVEDIDEPLPRHAPRARPGARRGLPRAQQPPRRPAGRRTRGAAARGRDHRRRRCRSPPRRVGRADPSAFFPEHKSWPFPHQPASPAHPGRVWNRSKPSKPSALPSHPRAVTRASLRLNINGRSVRLRGLRRAPTGVWRLLAIFGPGLIAASAGNDAGRHRHVFVGGRGLRVRTDLGDGPHHGLARRGAGNVRAAGRGDGPGVARPDPRTLRHRLGAVCRGRGAGGQRRAGHQRIRRHRARRANCWASAGYVAVPVAAVVLWYLVIYGSYGWVERVFLAMTLVFFAYPVAAFMAHPHWGEVAARGVRADAALEPRLPVPARRAARDDDHALHAAFPAKLGRGKGRRPAALRPGAPRRLGGRDVFQRHVDLHDHRHRRDAARRSARRRSTRAADAARALEPVVGHAARTLFASACWARRCWRGRCCRWRRRTRSARRSARRRG